MQPRTWSALALMATSLIGLGCGEDAEEDGSDGSPCPAGQMLCSGTCIDVQYDGETCSDWTSTQSSGSGGPMGGGPMVGHAWPAFSGQSWISAHSVPGCAPSAVEGEGSFGGDGVGDSGGYGAIYCFALSP